MWILKQALFVMVVGSGIFFVSKRWSPKLTRHEAVDFPVWKHALIAGTLFAFLVPIVILGREFGHWLAGRVCGLDVILHHDEVRFRKPQNWTKQSSEMLIFAMGGPVVELTLATFGCCGLWKFRQKEAASAQPVRFWIFSLFALFGLRWLRYNLLSESDETMISKSLGLPPYFVAAVLLLPALFVTWLIVDTHRTNRTLLPLVCSVPIGAASALFYLNVLGPAAFPPKSRTSASRAMTDPMRIQMVYTESNPCPASSVRSRSTVPHA